MGLSLGADLLSSYDGDRTQLAAIDINQGHIMTTPIATTGRRAGAEHDRAAIKLHLRNMCMTMYGQPWHI